MNWRILRPFICVPMFGRCPFFVNFFDHERIRANEEKANTEPPQRSHAVERSRQTRLAACGATHGQKSNRSRPRVSARTAGEVSTVRRDDDRVSARLDARQFDLTVRSNR